MNVSLHDIQRRRDLDERLSSVPLSVKLGLRSAPASQPNELRASERFCQDLTRREASNFYWGFIALPRSQRVAIYALYSFARQVDDDADLWRHSDRDDFTLDGRDRFAFHRERIDRGLSGEAVDPVMRVLASIVERYGIPRDDLDALIRGVEMDLRVTRYADWPQLRSYCELVASTIGRMCVRIFGYSDPIALELATDLGVAMQLANILRDVREDLALGRIYLPREDLTRFGVPEHALTAEYTVPGWEELVRLEAERAHCLFQSGLQVTHYIPRRAQVCVLTMAGIYREILQEIARDPSLPLRRRISLRKREKLSVMARSWLQAM
jgi:phytoene synthase